MFRPVALAAAVALAACATTPAAEPPRAPRKPKLAAPAGLALQPLAVKETCWPDPVFKSKWEAALKSNLRLAGYTVAEEPTPPMMTLLVCWTVRREPVGNEELVLTTVKGELKVSDEETRAFTLESRAKHELASAPQEPADPQELAPFAVDRLSSAGGG